MARDGGSWPATELLNYMRLTFMKSSLLNSSKFSVDMLDHEIILRIKQFKKCLLNKNDLLVHKSNSIDFMIIKIFP